MAKGQRGGGNRGSRGGGTSGRVFRTIAKRRKPGRPRKARRALSAGALGLPPGFRLPAPAPVDEMTGDVDVAEENAPKGEEEIEE